MAESISTDHFSILDVISIPCLNPDIYLIKEYMGGLWSCYIRPILSLVRLRSDFIKSVSVKYLSLILLSPSFACWAHDKPFLSKCLTNLIPYHIVSTCSPPLRYLSHLPIMDWRLRMIPISISLFLRRNLFSSKSIAHHILSHSMVYPADISSIPLGAGSTVRRIIQ